MKDLERLGEEITELAAHINAATAHWLGLIAEFDRREGWIESGCKSCAHWVAWRCSLAPNAARERVRVAHLRVDEQAPRRERDRPDDDGGGRRDGDPGDGGSAARSSHAVLPL